MRVACRGYRRSDRRIGVQIGAAVLQKYLIKRAFRALLVIWLVSTVVFLALRTVGNPEDMLVSLSGGSAEAAAKIRAFLKLDVPLYQQYGSFLVDAAQGDMGESFRYRQPALPIVLKRLPATMELAAVGLLIGVLGGGILGIVAAMRPNTWVDQLTVLVALLGQATPVFWLGIMLVLLFSVRLDWLPTSGKGDFTHLILPGVCLSNFTMASVARLIRSTMLDVMSQDYIRTARAKGLETPVIVIRHALKNAVLPTLTVTGLQLAALLSGAVVIETVFGWPGIGSMIFSAINARDFPLVQAGTIIFGVTVVLANLLVDVLYAYVDPRIRYE